MTSTLHILSIDPGTRGDNPAGGALLTFEGGEERLMETWLWSPDKRLKAPHKRIWDIARQIADAARDCRIIYRDLVLCYEAAWQGVNPQTGLKLATAGGAVIGIGATLGLEAVPFQPLQGKVALAGDRHADAAMMCMAARVRFDLAELPSEHVAAAIGGALWLEGELRRARMAREAVRG